MSPVSSGFIHIWGVLANRLCYNRPGWNLPTLVIREKLLIWLQRMPLDSQNQAANQMTDCQLTNAVRKVESIRAVLHYTTARSLRNHYAYYDYVTLWRHRTFGKEHKVDCSFRNSYPVPKTYEEAEETLRIVGGCGHIRLTEKASWCCNFLSCLI